MLHPTLRSKVVAICAALAACVALGSPKNAAAQSEKAQETARAKAVAKGIEFLRKRGQAADGTFSAATGIGVTALVTTALLRNGVPPEDPMVAKSLKVLEANVQPDGGVYKPRSMFRNYETCLAVMCFKEANKTSGYKEVLANADKFLKKGQIGNGDGVESGDEKYGGVGYGNDGRPDLSNTAFFIEALRATGNSEDDEAIQRAIAFVSRCQNHESEHNNTPHAAKNPDGGFYYRPGDSPAGETANGGLRSYGAMSYAGLKSMIYAGLSKDDPRVKAALNWAKQNYAVDSNPGLGTGGLYYYLHLMSTAMNAAEIETLQDKKGKDHNWRGELIDQLVRTQQANGEWTNSNNKWLEGDPNLVTGYALLTLANCKPPAKGAAPK